MAARAAEGGFDFEALRAKAEALAAKPYVEAPSRVPPWLLQLSYDDYRKIRFNQNRSWWRQDNLPFQLQFFHPGFLLKRTVQIAEISDGEVEPVKFDRKLFNYDDVKTGELPASMGYAGFRMLYDLNKPDDELGAFQGASYFRLLCRDTVYGLSARGLALNTAEAGGEEFPAFTEFWVEKPAADATSLVIYALLDGPSVAGAYRFVIQPGADTVTDVRLALYFRRAVKTVGIAPLTSMFWHGENTNRATDDFRPEVHDSDGLMIQTGAGEWVWRPLTNPKAVRVAAFGDEKPRGFGLFQRDRDFEHYQDLEARYDRRPSAWVEPKAGWGAGSVRLVEIPTPDESNDNIVAFWSPDQLPPKGAPLELEYRLHWFADQIHPPAGYAAATRHGRTKTHEQDLERFIVNFNGPYLDKEGPDPAIEPVVTVGEGAKLASAIVQKNPHDGSWRVAFAIKPDGSGHPVELRCFLRKPPHVLTETWTYLWQP
ncbi:MAG TPA: glucan biosynthesis protein G [Opitutus sp.]|nr:glucan biosynthesis protein G [Opitutus sp.]